MTNVKREESSLHINNSSQASCSKVEAMMVEMVTLEEMAVMDCLVLRD